MTVQHQQDIKEKFCYVCKQRIYLDETVKSKSGHCIPLNGTGTYHNPLHSFIYKQARQTKFTIQLDRFEALTKLLDNWEEEEQFIKCLLIQKESQLLQI